MQTHVVATTLSSAIRRAPDTARRWDSQANELKVVIDPQNPIPNKAKVESELIQRAAKIPKRAEPATFTTKVPHGNSGVHRR
jgi:hypothetical protein